MDQDDDYDCRRRLDEHLCHREQSQWLLQLRSTLWNNDSHTSTELFLFLLLFRFDESHSHQHKVFLFLFGCG